VIDLLLTIAHKEIYLVGLLAAMIIGGVVKTENYFVPLYRWLNNTLRSKKASLVIVSALSGIFPIEGRCTVSAPIMDSLCKSKHREKMGILDYIATHHYYLWSPLEPSVLIFMSVLGISWFTFMQATIIPLIVYLLFMLGIVMFYVKDVDVETPEYDSSPCTKETIGVGAIMFSGLGLMLYDPATYPFYVQFPIIATALIIISNASLKTVLSFIRWKMLGSIGVIIGLGTYAKTYNAEFTSFITNGEFAVPVLLAIGTLMAVIMGSSSKYAGIGALIVSLTNITLLPLVIVFEFAGYLISPTHKCLGISNMYFGTKISHMIGILGLLIACLITAAIGAYYWYA